MDSFLRIRHFTPPRVCAKLVINNPLLFIDTGLTRFFFEKYLEVGNSQFPSLGVFPMTQGLYLRRETMPAIF
jgi:hypothetical protein